MVAAHRNRPALDEIHHHVNRPFRIGAISDVIAEANDPFRAARPREIEARAKGLPVGMDIREDGQPHAFLHLTISPTPGPDLMDIKQHAARGAQPR